MFDNVDNPKLPDVEDDLAYDVRPYFPTPEVGSILITTRSSRLRLGRSIHLRKFTDTKESISLLAKVSGRPIDDTSQYEVYIKSVLTFTRSLCHHTSLEAGRASTCSCERRCISISAIN